MHSSNDFPYGAQYFDIKMGNRYEFRFNRWKIKLLEAPYETNCVYYNLESRDSYTMNMECTLHCYEQELQRKCFQCSKKSNCEPCFLSSMYSWTMDWLKKYDYDKLKPCGPEYKACHSANGHALHNLCIERCRPDCVSRYYFLDDNSPENLTTSDNWAKMTQLYIYDNKMPDQITEHTEDMTFVDFFGTFGGVFGIWWGLSIVAIIEFIMKYVPYTHSESKFRTIELKSRNTASL